MSRKTEKGEAYATAVLFAIIALTVYQAVARAC
jgi:hypothetical protein